MEEEGRFPYRFFVVTFAWSWLIWLPLVLAGAGVIPLGKHLLGALTVPWISLGVFGPAVGAFYCLRASRGRGAVRQSLRRAVRQRPPSPSPSYGAPEDRHASAHCYSGHCYCPPATAAATEADIVVTDGRSTPSIGNIVFDPIGR